MQPIVFFTALFAAVAHALAVPPAENCGPLDQSPSLRSPWLKIKKCSGIWLPTSMTPSSNCECKIYKGDRYADGGCEGEPLFRPTPGFEFKFKDLHFKEGKYLCTERAV